MNSKLFVYHSSKQKSNSLFKHKQMRTEKIRKTHVRKKIFTREDKAFQSSK